jgi:hypothetical protein
MSRPKLAKISRKPATALTAGLESLRNRNWRTAFSQLAVADQASSLTGDELEALAIAAHLSGNEAQALELLARIHQAHLDAGNIRRAARFAFWIGFIALNDGQLSQSSGWLARAARLLEDQETCAEHGYLLIPAGIRAGRSGQIQSAVAAFVRAGHIGKQFADKDLMTMALNGHGRALIRGGDHAKGVKLLDEAMVAVVAGEVSPIVAGGMYCSVLESCHETHDLGRAQEWTRALDQWCAGQPEIVPYRGHCLFFFSFAAPGMKPSRKRSARAIASPSPLRSRPWVPRCIAWANSIASRENFPKPKMPISPPPKQGIRRSPASLFFV